jgi:hypothetical protein
MRLSLDDEADLDARLVLFPVMAVVLSIESAGGPLDLTFLRASYESSESSSSESLRPSA